MVPRWSIEVWGASHGFEGLLTIGFMIERLDLGFSLILVTYIIKGEALMPTVF